MEIQHVVGTWALAVGGGLKPKPSPLELLSILDWLNKVHFETRVTSVDYTDKNVTVHTTKGCFTGNSHRFKDM